MRTLLGSLNGLRALQETILGSVDHVTLMAPRTSLYEARSHFKHWRYSPEQLVQIRSALNAAAVDIIRGTFESDEACVTFTCDSSVS
jgi:hypothetical protein